MKSVIEAVGSEFTRIRIGIGAKPHDWVLADYVLSHFSKSEFQSMVDGVTMATDAIETIIKDGIIIAMGKFNKKQTGELDAIQPD
jgi:PTH1 family peptidyl-tRNA hydrolase